MALPKIRGIKSPITNTKRVVAPNAERRVAAQKRLNSMKRKQFAKNFLSRYGLDETNIGKTKLFTETLGIFSPVTSRDRSNDSINLPNLDTPVKVSNDNNPTLQTLEKQFRLISNQLKILESLAKKQQNNLVSQLLSKEHSNKESILEAGKHGNLEAGGSPLQLEPLSDEVTRLSNSIGSLIDILDKKSDEAGIGSGSFLDNLKERFGISSTKTSRAAKRETSMVERLAANDNNVSRLSKFGKLGKAADIIGKGIRSGTQAAARLGGSSAKAIEKLALPIIEKGLGKTVLKSIPIVGAVAGVGFAVNRLLEGDTVGAGLDAASGLGGPMTAIPAFIASTVRDIYSSLYGVQPEEDPNSGERISEITSVVKKLVASTLGKSIDARPATQNESPGKGATGPAAAVMKSAGFSTGGSIGSAASSDAHSPAAQATSTVKPEPTHGSTGQSPSAPSHSESPHSEKLTNTSPVTQHLTPTRNSAKLIQMSEKNEELQQPKIVTMNDSVNLPTPQKIITKSGTASIGNVPDPTYHLSATLAKQLYF